MKRIGKGIWIYSALLIVGCLFLIGAVCLKGENLFFQEEQGKGEETITVYKTEENYFNRNFAHLVKNKELHIKDCGAVADSTYDYGDLLRSAINTCINTGAKLVLEKGTDYCSPAQ